ncbi:MAG: glycosyltransferase family 4 protein [Thiotrichales bacterium]|nr:glycosyltransferase family 4 protein [Thiotrichales bacterium]
MKILFLSHYFPPEVNAPATRTWEHCKHWVLEGHEVTVISCVPHHPMGKAYPGYRNRIFQSEYKDGIRAIKVLTCITANEGFVKRTFNYLFYMIMVILVAPFTGKTDIVLSTSPQFFNGLAGYFVSRIKSCPWVLEIRDLWPESILAVGAIRNRTIISVLEWLERFAYNKADRIVSVTFSFLDHIKACGTDPKKLSVIRNGVDLDFFNPMPGNEHYARELGVEGKYIAAYVGTHGMAHGLDTLLDAARLTEQNDIVYVMAGDGAEKKRLQQRIEDEKINNVLMLGQLPKERMPDLWSITDVSLVLLRNKDLFLSVIPSKIFESMAMKTPVILGVKGESRSIIEEAGAGIGIKPESAEDLAEAVLYLYQNREIAKEMGEKGNYYVSRNFNRVELAREYLGLLANVVNSRMSNTVSSSEMNN